MNTPTPSRILRYTYPITALIVVVLLVLTYPSIIATASDDPQQPTPSGTPDDGLDPTATPSPTLWPSPTPYPSTTPTPTPILDITPTFTPTPTNTPPPVDPPDIEISPTSFDVILREGQIGTEDLLIQNVGESILTFSITTSSTTNVPLHSLRFPATKIEAGLVEQIEASPDQQATFVVYLTTQADLSSAFQLEDWSSRGDFVYHALLNTAQQTQANLIQLLDQLQSSGAVSGYRPFYIVNAIAVTAGLDVLNALAARPDVAYIEAEKVFHIPEPIPADDISTEAVEWGVSKIRADQVWSDFDLHGEGVVVANIDTGVLHTHPALVNQYRGAASGSHNYNWFDPRGAATPFDNNGHGTHTMGTMVGSDGGSNQIGIAPAAKWIAAKGCYSSYCTESDLLASAEWVLAPYPYGGSPSQGDPNMRPHVVNNSWGGWGGDLWYQASVNAWRAASIFPAFSAGNSGPGSGTVGSPGDYAESFASGATDSSDVIASFSSRGPSSLTNETKPDVSAPGVNVRSSYNNGDYYTASGTSMASPHTAGCVALVLSAAPNLNLISVENLLTSTAIDLGASGPDYTYGYGRIDCYSAVSEAQGIGVPWLTVDPESGSVSPLERQTIILTVDARNLTAGEYGAMLTIHSNDPDENPLDVPITLHVIAEEPDIEVSPSAFRATLPVGGSAESILNIANTGGEILTFELDVSTDDHAPIPQGGPDGFGYTMTDSNISDGPVFDWIDISDSGSRLDLSDGTYFFPIDLPFSFNFYGTDYNQVAVSSYGTIYFQDAYLGLGNAPIPSQTGYTPQVFIAVYWDNLNPVVHGDVYYEILGAEPHRKLIVQYQEVAHNSYPSAHVTAQAILFEGSNSILVQYLDPSPQAGALATEGIQGDSDPETNWGLQYGYNSPVLSENLVICYAYPDMPMDCPSGGGPPPSWLSVEPTEGEVEPETSQNVVVSFNATYLNPGTYLGTIFVHSNDPDENPITVPVTLHVTASEPDIEISPTSFEVNLPVGEATEENLNIANAGNEILTFELDVSTDDLAPIPQGGPDGFGYTMADSNISDGPVFDWIDIRASGTRLSLSDDSYFFPIDLPFSFNFYGTDYDQVAVASNGTVYFQDAYLGYNNTTIPSVVVFTPKRFIAVYWDDLNPADNGDIYYQILGTEPHRKLVVQYEEVAHYGKTYDYVTAQAILFEGSNSILVQYRDPSNEAGSGATEGIQGDHDPEINWGIQYGYNSPVLSENLAICYAYPEMPMDCSSGGPPPSWLSVEPDAGAVEPETSQNIIVSVDAADLNPGTYSGSITINSNDPDENPLTVPVTLHVTAPEPDIEIDPTSFEVTLPVGDATEENLAIANVGGELLTFELDVSTDNLTSIPQGGPDGFGYTMADSNISDGPVFNWIDISDSGTRLSLSDDSYVFPIDLPYNFNFYGTDYNQVAVASNGTVYFQDAYLGLGNAPIPSQTGYTPQVFIAVYWDDLNPAVYGDVYYEIVGAEPHRKLIVQYQEVAHYGYPSAHVSAQAILFEGSNSILVQYLDPSPRAGALATEGIQGDPDPETNWGLQYGYNSSVLSQNLAICYAYPDMPMDCSSGGPPPSWLSVEPDAGAVEPETSQNIIVSVDAADLKPGTYSGFITINSNDPDENPLTVPVTLNATAPEPDIEISPTSFEVTLLEGGATEENLAITNTGGSALNIELEVSTSGSSPIPPDDRDAFGYSMLDSNQAGGPAFTWIDISNSGSSLSLSDDSYFFPIDLPFDFNFYGVDYNQVAVASNGTIYFQDTYLGYNNLPIPTELVFTPQAFIAVYWDDLNPGSGGGIYYEIVGSAPDRKLIVQWQEVPHYGYLYDTVTAQVILLEGSNSVLVQYLEPSNEAGSGATEGIQGDPNPDVNWNHQYGYNSAVLTPDLAICYAYPDTPNDCGAQKPPWLSVDPNSSSIGPGASLDINVSLDAAYLNPGDYAGSIIIHNNDPDENPLIVPVTLHVTAPEPDIEVSPTSYDVTLPPGKTRSEDLTISNLGDANLSFQVTVDKSAPVDWQPLSFPASRVDPELRNIDLFASNSHATFLVYLNRQANLASAFQVQDREARGDFVFQTLQNTAQRTQAGLISYLESQRSSGAVSDFRSFFIVNAISVTASLDVLNDLAARPDVAYIEAEQVFHIPDPIPADDVSIDAVEWGVSKIRADQVWSEFDIQGEGIVVANIDTGVQYDHPALVNQYRGTSTGSHNYNWFDPRGASTPFDNHGHGSHTMGTMVGSDGGSNQIGVAPAAKWITAKGCYSSSCTDTDLLASAEWILAPYPYGGSPSDGDPNMRPHVVNNSWGGGGGNLWYQASVNAWRAAGIFPAFSAGNSGPGSGTVGSPGDYAESFASGATDISDVIAYFSSRGPSSLTNETKPDVSAPGVSVRSAYNNGGYTSMSGTSMASPHTAGCVALILSAAPDMDLVSIENLLMSTAVDLGASGPDYTFGHGRIDCYAAVSEVGSSWLRVTPISGTVQPGSSQNLTVTFDSSELSPGTYTANIEIRSNDPDEGLIRVSVTLTVTNYVD